MASLNTSHELEAVSPRHGSSKESKGCLKMDAKKRDKKVGLYATGGDEGVQDDLYWIPDELWERNELNG